ncbi:MarR family winged helix-turn-helix transcriptional regulator [Streptomyces ochraceiscleroticus]|uniref:MarR family winged helix-turn-helix transcriptional regulator n=1 Tax=Streptomyces ochraceiscleroticus TaxID=47761 RepID=A0ABW1MTG5_9ACTN|nr:MarR family transcriptional regulator [Streptomyces ochraceiscleroticus]
MPTKGTAHEQLVTDLSAAVGLLMRRLRAESPSGQLTPTQRAVCARLDSDGPATTAALARAELVRPQSMRVTLAALEERGVIARSPHPTDGRQAVLALTEEGRRVLADVRRAKQNWLTAAIAEHTTPEERRVLAEAAALLKRLTEN